MTVLVLFLVIFCLMWIARLSGRLSDLEKERSPAQTKQGVSASIAPSIPQAPVTQPMSKQEAAAPKPQTEKRAEEEIATNWLTRIGVVALLFGVGFFLKYAIDQGWINELMRVMIGVSVGVLLIILGEIWKSKYRDYALSLSGGGIGILYFSVTAAYQFYGLVSHGAAFGLAILITLVAAFLAYRYQSLPLALLSTIGSYASPLLLYSGRDQQIQLFFYMTILNMGILTVLVKKYWFELLYVAFIGTGLNFLVWVLRFSNSDNTLESVVFLLTTLALFWVITMLLLRLHETEQPLQKSADDKQGMFMVLSAIYFVIAVFTLLYGNFHHRLALVSFLEAAVALVTYLFAARQNWPVTRYTAAFSAFVLFVMFNFWQFDGAGTDVSIFVLAIAGIFAGAFLGKPELRVAGVSTLFFGMIKTFANSYEMQSYTFLLNEKFALSALYIVGGWIVSRFWNRDGQKIKAISALALWFAVTWEIVAYFQQFPGSGNSLNLSISIWWITYAVVVLIYGVMMRDAFFRKLAIILFGLSIVKVFVYDVQSLDTGYRIVSFITLGVILLSVSFAYHKNKEKITFFLE